MTKGIYNLNVSFWRIHLIISCSLFALTVTAQEPVQEVYSHIQHHGLAKTWELGFLLGTSNYSGTLTPKLLDTHQFHTSAGIYGQYNFNNWFSLRSAFEYARVSGTDLDDPEYGRRKRSCNFRSDIYEWSVTGQIHLLPYGAGAGQIFSPSIFAGVAVFHMNPEARIYTGLNPVNGEPMYVASSNGGKTFFNSSNAASNQYVWVPLQPIGTEGQTAHQLDIDPQYAPRKAPNPYSLWQMSIPFGMDFDFIVNSSWTIGLEAGLRFTNTGYLDDVNGYYFDRKDNFSEIDAVNTTIYGYVGDKKITVPNITNFNSNGNLNSLYTAAILADPSLVNAVSINPTNGKQIFNNGNNDAYTYPNALRGNFSRDWYCIFNIKASKVFGYNRVDKKVAKELKNTMSY